MSGRSGGSDWGGSDPWFDSADNRPPDDPPKVIFHNPFPGQQIPEEYRRVFGSPPPPNSKRPVPPPPLPPNSYHKKPKYWQLRHTSAAEVPNRIAGVVCLVMCGFGYLIHRYSGVGERLNRRFGNDMTIEEKKEYDEKNQLYYNMLIGGVDHDAFAVDFAKENYINVHKADKKVRWDLREMDRNIPGLRDLQNPFDDAL